ncbi:MAG: gamma carbonic anhydrase family protein [Pseudomonadota bacterium]|nr:gamma carbonic anhydrase family protein [Pseudomonadota bacterium]
MSSRIFDAKQPYVAMGAYVDAGALLIGDVEVGEDSSVWPMAVLRGDVQSVRVGNRTNIQDGCVLHVTHAGPHNERGRMLSIGDEVTVGHNATLHGCTIKDRCLIGMGAIVMDGAVVESDVIIAAGSLVTENTVLKSGFLYMGSPAKEARALTQEERDFIKYSASQYITLKNHYLAEIQAKVARERMEARERDKDRERI